MKKVLILFLIAQCGLSGYIKAADGGQVLSIPKGITIQGIPVEELLTPPESYPAHFLHIPEGATIQGIPIANLTIKIYLPPKLQGLPRDLYASVPPAPAELPSDAKPEVNKTTTLNIDPAS